MAAGVQEVAIDPFAPYAAAVRQLLPAARLVVDKWHVIRLFARALDTIRRRTVQEQHGRRGRKADLLWRSRMLLLKRFSRLDDRQRQRLFKALETEDPRRQVTAAYIAYQEALQVFERRGTTGLRSALAHL